jgi:seryl-tRNA synthetase
MHDIKAIRENPTAFDAGLARRGLAGQSAMLLEIDEQKRAVMQKLQDAQSRRNALSKDIGAAMGKKDVALAERLKADVANLKDDISTGEDQERLLTTKLNDALAVIPNIPLPDVPDGKDEHGNVEVRRWGTKPILAFEPQQHFDIGEGLRLMDFDIASKLSGARFVVLKGALARMERALAQFMVDLHTSEFGYDEIYAPYMLREECMFGVGQLPKSREDMFQVNTGHFLIPTAEASLTNLVREQVLDEAKLPLRMTAYTPCFRAEAGAAGRDTRGMIRQHQFSKVELVTITTAEHAEAEHERMTGCAEEILKRLNLHYRTMLLCSGDMGFGSRKTYDLEVWLPGQNTFREISSCSQFGEFQARRMDARCKAADAKQARFVHTLNGSALAVGRTMVAILENYQNDDGSVTIPDVLQPYMGGMKIIKRPS